MDSSNNGYKLLELIALSGEFSPSLVARLGISPSYSEKLITRLKEQRYIRTHYKNRLRGYRLTSRGKKLLLASNPDRFLFYLSGSSETYQPRSSLPRRQRLQYASHVYVMLRNAEIRFFRDQKPLLFRESADYADGMPFPIFYHSREIKELGAQTIQINNSRSIGILFSPDCIYVFFYTGDGLMKWEYRTELKLKALLSDLQPPNPEMGMEHDAVSESRPVLLAFDFDMQRISHFRTALSFRQSLGNLICFDFQFNVLHQYFGETAAITTINLEKLERKFIF